MTPGRLSGTGSDIAYCTQERIQDIRTEKENGMPDSNEKLIEDLTTAIEDLLNMQDQYSSMLDQIEEENRILSDTIEQNRLGNLASERKEKIGRAHV